MSQISEWEKLLANPLSLDVIEIDKRPAAGDHVEILDWLSFSKKEAVKYSKFPFLTIEESYPVVIGLDGEYEWKFNISVKEAPEVGEILSWHYKVIKERTPDKTEDISINNRPFIIKKFTL